MTRRKLAILGLCILTGAAIGETFAPQAHADESSFLTAIANDGMPVNTTTLTLGHQVCTAIISDGVAGVDSEVRMGLAAGLSSLDVANFIGDSVFELCPSGLPAMKSWAATHSNGRGSEV